MVKIPKKTNLKNERSLDDLYLPLGFKQHFVKSILNPILEDGTPKDYSGIIFGPPGTGKTSVIKAAAKEINWELIEIGPHDFAGQSKSIEQTITEYFQEIQKYVKKSSKFKKTGKAKIIFVFDEIDALVTSRDTNTDRNTSFVTTMMLPLFQELRDKAKDLGFIFFVLTNHIERFDPAVKRKGRFDFILPLGPPDHQARFRWFKSCFNDLNEYYKKKYNLEFLIQYSFIGSYIVESKKEKNILVMPAHRDYTNFDVLAKASYRLNLTDIKTICERVLDRRITMEPSLRQNTNKNISGRNKTRIYTSNFIDWINKYRNSDPSTQNEIERFYRDADIYARSSYPYPQQNSLQEKMEHEFSSLIINDNIKYLKNNWKIKTEKTIKFSLENLSEYNVFSGSLDISVILNEKEINKTEQSFEILSGRESREYTLGITPKKSGKMTIKFKIEGVFHLRGSESVLDQNSAELKGKVEYKKEITIK